jgi:hypothetical protein
MDTPHIIVYPDLPLALYREIAAHLQQVKGVQASLSPQPPSSPFNYRSSQVATLHLTYTPQFQPDTTQEVWAILNYYAQRHGRFDILDILPAAGGEDDHS